MWVGTFHGLAHRLLRAHWQEARLPQHFPDPRQRRPAAPGQARVPRAAARRRALAAAQAQWFINKQKDEGLRAAHIEDAPRRPYLKQMQRVYRRLRGGLRARRQRRLRRAAAARPRAVARSPDMLRTTASASPRSWSTSSRTPTASSTRGCGCWPASKDKLFVVGDDDQSIYGWRGAKSRTSSASRTHYPRPEVSAWSRTIAPPATSCKAANAVIANNPTRLGKQLWTEDADGEPIRLYGAFNEVDEARFRGRAHPHASDRRGRCRRRRVRDPLPHHAQSRLFEEALIQAGIPYRVYGGLRFFERAEIKDALAYLRLLVNRHDDPRSSASSTSRPAASARDPGCLRAHARDFAARCGRRPAALCAGGCRRGRPMRCAAFST
jgi:DNA helicase-2/ATP-dependent DNA helicase PcrA